MALARHDSQQKAADDTIKGLEDALAAMRGDGAPDSAAIAVLIDGTTGATLRTTWYTEVADPAEPAPDTREQPTQYATGGIVDGPTAAILHAGEAVVQPDGLINETPQAGA